MNTRQLSRAVDALQIANILFVAAALCLFLLQGCQPARAMGNRNKEQIKFADSTGQRQTESQSAAAKELQGAAISPTVTQSGTGTQSVFIMSDPESFRASIKLNQTAGDKEKAQITEEASYTVKIPLGMSLLLLGSGLLLCTVAVRYLVKSLKQSKTFSAIIESADVRLSKLVRSVTATADALPADQAAYLRKIISELESERGKLGKESL